MAVQEVLNDTDPVDPIHASVGCPKCGAAWGGLPAVTAHVLDREPLRRCVGCGTRFALGEAPAREVLTCELSGLPFHADHLLPGEEPISPDMRDGRFPELGDASIAEASEIEVCRALGRAWSFVGDPRLSTYLNRIARLVAARIPGAPERPRVAIFDDRHVRTLALPSGTILLSVGTLAFLADEAELVFVLGHELAHIASGDAAARLVWLGLQSVALEGEDDGSDGWVLAAQDLIRLGHGRRRESEADRKAFEALLELGYEPESVRTLLSRIGEAVGRGSTRVVELAAAHPTATERTRALDRTLAEWLPTDDAPKINRAVYRRAAGEELLRDELRPLPGIEDLRTVREREERRRSRRVRLGWLVGAIALLSALFVVFGRLFAD